MTSEPTNPGEVVRRVLDTIQDGLTLPEICVLGTVMFPQWDEYQFSIATLSLGLPVDGGGRFHIERRSA